MTIGGKRMGKTVKTPKYKKDKPDFKGCKDPEFAKDWWNYNEILRNAVKDNPFLKLQKKRKIK